MNVFLQMRSILEVVSLDFLIHLADVMGKHQENPGILGEKAEKIFKKFNDIRHLLLPYLYSTTYKNTPLRYSCN